MRRHILLVTIAVAPLLVAGTSPKPRYGDWGVATEDMDQQVKPGDDFFDYVEGNWLRGHPIAADKVGAGYNYELPDEIELQLRAIVEDEATQPSDPTAKKVGDFYAAWMDEAGIEARGVAPLKPYLVAIEGVRTRDELVRLMMTPGYASPVKLSISVNQDDPTRYTAAARQAQLGLPTRDYYMLKGAKYDAIRLAYHAYIVRVLTLSGISDAASKADQIVALETRLSEDQWTPERRRDPVATHNPMSRAQMMALAPEFDWGSTLNLRGLADAQRVDVAETTAVAAAGKRLADVPLTTWKNWLVFRFVSDHASLLPHAFDQAHFDFYSKTLNDVPEQRARWKRGVSLVDGSLGEAVGKIYIADHWSVGTQIQAEELVNDVRAAYADKIGHAPWMDEATRKAALTKLGTFDPRIGHPGKWIDYSQLAVSRIDPLANSMASDRFRWQLELARFPHAVDRGLWDMTPQTVNAITTQR
jgi:putative endopeptidase